MSRYIIVQTPPKVVVPMTRYHIAPAARPSWQMYGIAASITLNVALVLLILWWRWL